MQSVNLFSKRVTHTWAGNHFPNKQVLFTRIITFIYQSNLKGQKKGTENRCDFNLKFNIVYVSLSLHYATKNRERLIGAADTMRHVQKGKHQFRF